MQYDETRQPTKGKEARSTNMRTPLAAITPIAVMLAVAGCGGGSTSGGGTSNAGASTPDTLSRSELITRADAICSHLKARLAVPSETGNANDLRSVATVAPRRAALEQAALAELRNLVPPGELASDWQQIIAVRQSLLANLVALAEDAKRQDVQSLRRVYLQTGAVAQPMIVAARRIGVADCSSLS